MHESLKVYLKDRFVGWLSHESTGDVFSFKYDDAYLADPSDGALSFARTTWRRESFPPPLAWPMPATHDTQVGSIRGYSR